MFCSACGASVAQDMRFCDRCGTPLGGNRQAAQAAYAPPRPAGGLVGFSPKINDPAFPAYIQKNKRIVLIVGGVIAVIALIVSTIYGASQDDIPLGLAIGSFFVAVTLIINIFTWRKQHSGVTWDGTVTDKRVEERHRYVENNRGGRRRDTYYVNVIYIRQDSGKTVKEEYTQPLFDYFRIGDRLRRHPGMLTYEKYDNSLDAQILCPACMQFNPVNAVQCKRCKCPVLN